MKKLNIAVVGAGFGSHFIPIYQRHPQVGSVTLCETWKERRLATCEKFGLEKIADSFDAVLADPSIDAVHLCTGIPDHASQSLAVLRAGKHCACAVPMATSLDDLRAIVAAAQSSGRNYMMMETGIFHRFFLHAQKMNERGEFGRLQFLRGMHYQDMENWPPYWTGLPPMWYATHAITPLLALAGTRACSVRCLGSGFLREDLRTPYGNPFPIETAVFELERNVPLAMEITRALFHSAHASQEGFDIHGEDSTLLYPQQDEMALLYKLSPLGEHPGPRKSTGARIDIPYYPGCLPAAIASFANGFHGGSHPHLVHEFITSIIEGRKPLLDEIKSAQATAAGICAHQSAMRNGAIVTVPDFS